MFRGIRGATTVKEDNNELVLQETARLALEMARQNDISPSSITIILSASITPDIL